MAERTSSGTLSTIFAFAAGISTGALASMLFAPKSGAETREQIKNKIQNARSKAKEKVDEQKDMMKDKVEDVKGKAKQAADESRRQVTDNASTTHPAM